MLINPISCASAIFGAGSEQTSPSLKVAISSTNLFALSLLSLRNWYTELILSQPKTSVTSISG